MDQGKKCFECSILNDSDHMFDRISRKMKLVLTLPDCEIDDVEIHEIKSLLYAAIERTGIELNRLHAIQRLLRELFGLVSIGKDIREYERKAGLQILEDLQNKYLNVK